MLHKFFKGIPILFAVGILLWGCLIAMVWWKETHIPAADHYDAIVVLGAQVYSDGTPSLQLQWRLDTAYEAWLKHPCTIVTCGGQGANEPAPEGDIMKQYLIRKGIPEDQIISDSVSVNTQQNLKNAAAIVQDDGIVLIVTSNYHLPRAIALANDIGLRSTGIGAPIKKEYWIKNHAREALSWVKYWLQKYLF